MTPLPVVGDVSERIGSCFEWSIPIKKSWMTDDDNAQSPPFQFLDETWNLHMFYIAIEDRIGLFLVRDISKHNSKLIVSYQLSARLKHEKVHEVPQEMDKFQEGNNVSYIKYIEMSLIQRSVVSGVLIVTCFIYGNRSSESATTRRSKEDCAERTEPQEADEVKPAKRGTKGFENLSLNFKDLLVSGRGSDVTLKVNDREFAVHKVILSSRSLFFEKMFTDDMVKKEGAVDITDCTPDAFNDFLFYLYSGELEEFSRSTVFDLYLLSDRYVIQDLKAASVKFLAEDLCIDTFCDVVRLALKQSEAVLLEKATKFFGKNRREIIVTEKWNTFVKENPTESNHFHIGALNDEFIEEHQIH